MVRPAKSWKPSFVSSRHVSLLILTTILSSAAANACKDNRIGNQTRAVRMCFLRVSRTACHDGWLDLDQVQFAGCAGATDKHVLLRCAIRRADPSSLRHLNAKSHSLIIEDDGDRIDNTYAGIRFAMGYNFM